MKQSSNDTKSFGKVPNLVPFFRALKGQCIECGRKKNNETFDDMIYSCIKTHDGITIDKLIENFDIVEVLSSISQLISSNKIEYKEGKLWLKNFANQSKN